MEAGVLTELADEKADGVAEDGGTNGDSDSDGDGNSDSNNSIGSLLSLLSIGEDGSRGWDDQGAAPVPGAAWSSSGAAAG